MKGKKRERGGEKDKRKGKRKGEKKGGGEKRKKCASYLLGDSVTQFSTIIGTYLFAMGIGSYLSRYFNTNLLAWFIRIEILVGMVGGFSAGILFVLFEQIFYFRVLLYALVVVTGTLVGLELPLLMRILKDRIEFSELVSRIFTFDYIGALFASLLFPLLLIPHLGLLRTAFFFGFLNVTVAWLVAWQFRQDINGYKRLQWSAAICLALLTAGFILSDRLTAFAESLTYPDKIVYAQSSPYQRIVLTRSPRDWRLFLNGNLQFSSADEYRYHEALVHPGLSRLQHASNILILGGGDGMAVREVLRYSTIKHITLVDLDSAVTKLFRSHAALRDLNQQSLLSPKLTVINQDAFVWIRNQHTTFDFIIVDFPDPSNYSLGKLYTTSFYRELYRLLPAYGALVIQSTSPYRGPQIVLDHRCYSAKGGVHHGTLSLLCAIVWRVGLCTGIAGTADQRFQHAGQPPVCNARNGAAIVLFRSRHGLAAKHPQYAEQPGAGEYL